jgi:LemA protein
MGASWLPIVVIALLAAAIVWIFSRYNGLVRSKKRVEEAWSGIDVQLRRRASLIPNVTEIVKAFAEHERDVFGEVARARGALQQAGSAGQAADANNRVTQALSRLFAVVENYPQLRWSETMMGLRADLADVEEKIAFARQFYNRNVLDYNTRLDTYPDAIIANNANFEPEEFFEADAEGRAEVRVVLTRHREQPIAPPAA